MKKRNPIAVIIISFITFGIYSIYWSVVTKGEMNARGSNIPTAWLLIVPLANLYWLWKYCEGVEHVTDGKLNGVLAFVLVFLVGPIGQGIIQDFFNKLEGAPATAAAGPVSSAPDTSMPSSAPPSQPTDMPPSSPTPPSTPPSTPPDSNPPDRPLVQ